VDINLDTLKREILDYLEAADFAVFHSSPGGLEGLPMVLWDVPKHPDYQMFLDVARKGGAKLVIFAAREFEAAELDELVEGFRNRPLDRGPYTFVWIDALTQKVREGGRTVNVHCLIATGVNAEGYREILGIDVTSSEDGAGWLAFLRGLTARGLSGVAMVTSDDHAGLVNAIAAVLPGAAWQRCRTHYHRNLLTRVPKSAQPWVSTLVRTIFEQPDPASVRAQHAQVVAALEAKLPAAAAHLDDARDDILAFTAFPREVWRQVWSNNPQERLNKEIRRRTDVVGIFPGRDAIIRLVGAVLAEQNDEWTESRRYMGLEILAACRKAGQPDMGKNGTSEAGLTIEAIPA